MRSEIGFQDVLHQRGPRSSHRLKWHKIDALEGFQARDGRRAADNATRRDLSLASLCSGGNVELNITDLEVGATLENPRSQLEERHQQTIKQEVVIHLPFRHLRNLLNLRFLHLSDPLPDIKRRNLLFLLVFLVLHLHYHLFLLDGHIVTLWHQKVLEDGFFDNEE